MAWSPEVPYNQLPPLPPEGIDLEPKRVLKMAIEARAALATLAQASRLLPNPGVLLSSLSLLEAQASSEIENIVTTTDQLFQHAQGHDNADPATKEALRYRTALQRGYQSLKDRPLCTATAVDVCRTLKGVDMDIRRTPGTQLINDRTGEVIYTEPKAYLRKPVAEALKGVAESLAKKNLGLKIYDAYRPYTATVRFYEVCRKEDRSFVADPRDGSRHNRGCAVDLTLVALVAIIALALLFDFTNGFHDAANSVSTVVATRALPAKWAVWTSWGWGTPHRWRRRSTIRSFSSCCPWGMG